MLLPARFLIMAVPPSRLLLWTPVRMSIVIPTQPEFRPSLTPVTASKSTDRVCNVIMVQGERRPPELRPFVNGM
jgi:hypothetical protein